MHTRRLSSSVGSALLLVLSLASGSQLLGCQLFGGEGNTSSEGPTGAAPPTPAAAEGAAKQASKQQEEAPSQLASTTYGEAVGEGKPTPLSDVLAHPERFAEGVVTEGTVERACSRKGCWMELRAGEERCRVTFKDYGFFIPTDSAGSHARLRAVVETRTISAANVQHLEAEGASFSNKRDDGTAQEVQLVASAVELSRPGASP